MNSLISAYKNLIFLFTEKKEISAIKFETEFLKLFKNDQICDEDAYEIIKPLFYAVEDFCYNPELREKGDLDENQLAKVAKATLVKLEELETIYHRSLKAMENEADIKQSVIKSHEFLNILPLLIEEIVEKKLNDILPAIVKNALSEELHKLTASK